MQKVTQIPSGMTNKGQAKQIPFGDDKQKGQATAKANAGILSCAQNDGRAGRNTGVLRSAQNDEQAKGEMRRFFAALGMTSKRASKGNGNGKSGEAHKIHRGPSTS